MKKAKYIEGVGWRYDVEHSMLRRMQQHDYQSRCIYMLTLTLSDRSRPLFGKLKWETPLPSRDEQNPAGVRDCSAVSHIKTTASATVSLSPLGCLVEKALLAIPLHCPQISIIAHQLMPEHLHIVLFVKEHIPMHLGKYIGAFKNRCNKHYWEQLTHQGMLGPKGTTTPPSLFSQNFQDTILVHEGQLENMVNYVHENPYRALVKKENPALFQIVSNITIADHTFAAIGNQWLLNRPVSMQVRCHNNTTPENLKLIQKQKEYFLMRGEKGGVVVSPCISAGEKEIARAVLDAGQPLIVILDNGFPPMYKPPGKYFEACSKGLLLMLSPFPYQPNKPTITRHQCLELNAIAHAIASEPWSAEMESLV